MDRTILQHTSFLTSSSTHTHQVHSGTYSQPPCYHMMAGLPLSQTMHNGFPLLCVRKDPLWCFLQCYVCMFKVHHTSMPIVLLIYFCSAYSMESFVLYRFFRLAFGIQPDDFMVNEGMCTHALQYRGIHINIHTCAYIHTYIYTVLTYVIDP